MEDMIRVVAVPERRVIDPQSRRVVDERGVLVSRHDPHWTRLINDGDVETRDADWEPEPEPAADDAAVAAEPAAEAGAAAPAPKSAKE